MKLKHKFGLKLLPNYGLRPRLAMEFLDKRSYFALNDNFGLKHRCYSFKQEFISQWKRAVFTLYIKTFHKEFENYIIFDGTGDDCTVEIYSSKTTSVQDRIIGHLLKLFTSEDWETSVQYAEICKLEIIEHCNQWLQ